jgi:nitrite reductase/ring-hydroxylating ferredoxin subunit
MAELRRDPRALIDPAINSPGREGLTGTAPADLYGSSLEREQITIAPDFAPAEAQPAWRQDFPIDWPQDLYVERRDFLKFMVLISAAFTAGQMWIAAENWLRRRRGQPQVTRVASVDDVPVGGAVGFAYPGEHDDCLLLRLEPDVFVAYSQKCTHLSCAVLPQPEQGRIYCPCHQGIFDLGSGRPLAGPAQRPLTRILLEVRGPDVFARGIELRTV